MVNSTYEEAAQGVIHSKFQAINSAEHFSLILSQHTMGEKTDYFVMFSPILLLLWLYSLNLPKISDYWRNHPKNSQNLEANPRYELRAGISKEIFHISITILFPLNKYRIITNILCS